MKTFKTPDLALVATLKLNDVAHTDIECVPGVGAGDRQVAEFVFVLDSNTTDKLQTIATAYHAGLSLVEPRKFAVEFRDARDTLFAFLKAQRSSARR